jgi:hypothetical protein
MNTSISFAKAGGNKTKGGGGRRIRKNNRGGY